MLDVGSACSTVVDGMRVIKRSWVQIQSGAELFSLLFLSLSLSGESLKQVSRGGAALLIFFIKRCEGVKLFS